MVPKKKIEIESENDPSPNEASASPTDDKPATNATEEVDATDDVDPLKDLEQKLAAVQGEASENHDRLLRMAAEFDNYRKRTAREQEDLKKFATENLVRQLLTVVDNLERAIASAPADNENVQSVVDGVVLTLAEIKKILEKQQVRSIEALGEPFDPAFHQAMCQEESENHPPNTVIQEFQKGYLIHDRLLRPAMVVVSKAAQNGQSAEASVDTNA